MKVFRFILVSIFFLALVSSAAADTVVLKNGGKLEGKVTEKGDDIIIKGEAGEITVPKHKVERIEYDEEEVPEPPAPQVPEEPKTEPSEPDEEEEYSDLLAELEKLRKILEEGEPAYTREEVDKFAKELKPLVEEIAERKFKETPKIKLVARKELEEALVNDFMPQLRNLNSGLPDEDLRAAAAQEAKGLAMTILGKYSITEKSVLLLPRNLVPVFNLAKSDINQKEPVLRLVIAHELTHALQFEDEKLLESYGKISQIDALQAFSATIEGHAVLVQDMVGKKLGLDDAVLELSRLFAAGSVKLDDPGLEMLNRILSTQYEQTYLGGRMFMGYHFKKGGMKALWDILASPPAKTSMILRPDTYSTESVDKPDYSKLLDGMEKEFGDREWAVQNIELGHMSLRAVYAEMEEKVRDEIIGNIEHVRVMTAQLPDQVTIGNITVMFLKDPKLAPKMISEIEKLVEKNVDKIKESQMFTIKDFSIGKLEGIEADVTSRAEFTIEVMTGEKVRQAFYRIVRGTVVVEMIDSNLGLDDKKIISIAEKTFKRIEEMKK